jgi:DNA-binding beta-propeller fold protein YncE
MRMLWRVEMRLSLMMVIVLSLAVCYFSLPGGMAFAQPELMGGPAHGGDVSEMVRELLGVEEGAPASPENVRERYRKLSGIVSMMIRSGRPVRDVLSREDAGRIDSLLRSGSMEEASALVHEAVMRLGDVQTGEGAEAGMHAQTYTMAERPAGRISSEAPSPEPVTVVNITRLANRNSMDNVLKCMNPVVDEAGRRLYFTGSKSTYVGVVDIDRDELIETFDIGMPGGFLIFDARTQALYMIELAVNRLFKVDLAGKTVRPVSSLPSHVSIPKKGEPVLFNGRLYRDTGYPFKAGYMQDENASYGVIEVRDLSGDIVERIKHGPDALYFDIDRRGGKLYATNTGDGSISVFDLNKGGIRLKDIDVGNSIEEILLTPGKDGVYIRNRLGGSTIFHYDLRRGTLDTIHNENVAGADGIGMWPTGMVFDDEKLYVLSHFGGRIDVIDTGRNRVTGSIPLGLSQRPRTDAISTMVMDVKRKVIYAAIPELGELVAVDAASMKRLKTINIGRRGMAGPGLIVLGFDEVLNRLYVYIADEKRLHVYKGGSLRRLNTVSMDIGRQMGLLVSNPGKKVVYAGNGIYDAETFRSVGKFSRGKKVVAYDNSADTVYLTEMVHLSRAKQAEKLYMYEGLTLSKQWTLSPVLSIPSSFAFDFEGGKFYVGYFESGVLESYDLDSGLPPSEARAERERPSGATPASGRGRCGDGVCGPVERDKGVCPEDCN